ncbi:hypothetical protein C2R22_04910 [Salinigranum rubrum]|uniref:Uncharacterized protein n=1 Tax=Salinigranum rubrum TaxID=755307 RepID=A0A2I8VJ46_9EURY|nr:hypothetical protein [Salinigranum rubrum]AUV81079.1 hypothetical protein C2R22_04910 [Salinigranum rubrum]
MGTRPPDEFDERGWHEGEEGYLHECFCVRRDPWNPEEMPCPHPDDEDGDEADGRTALRFDLDVDLAFELRGRTVSISESFRFRT